MTMLLKLLLMMFMLLLSGMQAYDPDSKIDSVFKRDVKIETVVESIIEILEDTISEVQSGSIVQSSNFHKTLGKFYDDNMEGFLDDNPSYKQTLGTQSTQGAQPKSPPPNLSRQSRLESKRLDTSLLTDSQKRERIKIALAGDLKKEAIAQGKGVTFNFDGKELKVYGENGKQIDTIKVEPIKPRPGNLTNVTSTFRHIDMPYYIREYPLSLAPDFPAYSLTLWYNRSKTGLPDELMAIYTNGEDYLGMTRNKMIYTVDPVLIYSSEDSDLLVNRRTKRAIGPSTLFTNSGMLTDSQIHEIDTAMKKIKTEGCFSPDVSICKLGKNSDVVVGCKFGDCENDNSTSQAICVSNKVSIDDLCYSAFISMILISSKPGYIQPTIRHFTDNSPIFRGPNTRSLLEDSRGQGELISDKIYKCFNDTTTTISGGTCNTLISGDFNSVYATFKVYFSNKTNSKSAHVFTKNNEFWNCENKDPVWKDAEVYISITGQYDSVIYDIGKVDTIGYKQYHDCSFVICDICIKKVPVLLKGKCTARWNVDESTHYIDLCNKEPYIVAYYVQPMHDGPRMSTEIIYNSRFLIGNIIKFLYRKYRSTEFDITFESPTGSAKGVVLPGRCQRVSVADSKTNWIYYYAKCGETIHFHHEEITNSYKCKLVSLNSYWPWFYYINCNNWVFFRLFYIMVLLITIVYIFRLLKVGYWFQNILCYLSSPLSYLLFKLTPKLFRCKKCMYPWAPWHKCPEYCVCGYYFSSLPTSTHVCPLADEKRYKIEKDIIDDYEGLDITNKIKKVERVKLAQQKLKSLGKRLSKGFDYKLFSSSNNPYTCYVSTFLYVFLIYLTLCLLMPVTLAGCVECTGNCFWTNSKFMDSCENPTQSCICNIIYRCNSMKSQIVSVSSIGDTSSEKILKQTDNCLNTTNKDIKKYTVEFYMFTILKQEPCLLEKFPDTSASRTYIFRIVRGLATASRLLLITGDHPKVCRDFREWLESHSDYNDQLTQKSASVIGTTPDIQMSRNPQVKGLRSNVNLREQSDESVAISNLTRHIKNSLSTLQNSVEEQQKEDMSRKKAQLQTELNQIMGLLKYNGSIYGRDHLILFPDPPPFHQSVYTLGKGDGAAILDMTIPAKSGASAAFRPIHNGREVPITIVLAVPETAGVYEVNYQYTTCKTRSIEVVRHDKCVGQCNECFNILKADVRKDSSEHSKWGDFSLSEPISHDDVNNWACEGNGCWTVNTGCLCAYCRNIPDPENCYDVFKLRYKTSKALLCLGVNDDRQCEQFNIGDSIQRSGKLQVQLQGSDEWSSLIKTESVAIHRTSSEILMGPIANLGELTTDFGTPQYNTELNVTYKERDVVDSYVCHEQIDQEVIVNSCFKDTFNMVQELSQAPAYVLDSKKRLIYHMDGLIGTYRLVMTLPMSKLNWIFSSVKINIPSVSCSGCFRCLKGSTCNAKVDSSITGLVNIFVEGGIIRISTMNILKGIRTYTFTVDYDVKSPKSILHIQNPETNKDYASRSISAVLSEGNSPRTTVRNVSSVDLDIIGENDNTWGYVRNGIYKYNPISYLSSWFKSSLFHWIATILISIILFGILFLILYLFLTRVYGYAINKASFAYKKKK